MINRVVVAGRLAEAPVVRTTAGGTPLAVLTLDVQHVRSAEAEPEVACLEVHAYGGGRAAVLERYLGRGSDVLVQGYLRREAEGLVVVCERFEFMERSLVSRPLWAEAAPAAAG